MQSKVTDYNHAPPIHTRRLLLRPVNMSAAENIFREFSIAVTRYMTPAPAKDMRAEEKIVKGFVKSMSNGIECVYAIFSAAGEFIGLSGIHALKSNVPEFGIWTKLAVHGHGYGREAVHGVYEEYCRDYSEFEYPVDERNFPSRKIAESLDGVSDGKITETKGHGGNDLRIIKYLIPGKLDN